MQLQSQDGDHKDIAFGKMQYWNHWLSSDEDLAFFNMPAFWKGYIFSNLLITWLVPLEAKSAD